MLTRASLLCFTGLLFALWCGPLHAEPFRDCDVCPEMVVVPAGKFMMGSPEDEWDRQSDEGPQHRERIRKRFAAGRFEITFAEWDACVADGGCDGYRPDDEGFGRGRHPVINVSWNDARSYVGWLSHKTGKTYRLLSEAEWEYAARAGTATPFHFGGDISPSQANYNGLYAYIPDISGRNVGGLNRGKPLPVGSFPANAFGLHDMHGNVWEWTGACWTDDYKDTYGDCDRRVLRGGSWAGEAWTVRAANRSDGGPDLRLYFVGFRVARNF